MSQLFKEIQITNLDTIIEQSLYLIPEEKKNNTGLFYFYSNKEKFLAIPALAKLLSDLDLLEHVAGIALYIVHRNAPISIHKDNGDITYSLNIPLSGCENTLVNFYNSTKPPLEKITMSGNKYFAYDESDCQLIDSLEMTTAHIINVKVPHAVVNNNSEPRITLLIRLNNTAGELI